MPYGFVGFVNGSQAEQYRFTLLLPGEIEAVDEIDWNRLLPGAGSGSEWVVLDDGLITIDTRDFRASRVC
jgi:hypothetical protein